MEYKKGFNVQVHVPVPLAEVLKLSEMGLGQAEQLCNLSVDMYSILSHNTTFSKMNKLGVYSGPQLDSNRVYKNN